MTVPVSVMKFVKVKAPATEYNLICFMFGGAEPAFAETGFSNFNYVAAIKLGANPTLLLDTLGGAGTWSAERAGYVNDFDLIAAWRYILLHFEKLPEQCVLDLEPNERTELGFSVKSVEEV